MDDNTYELQIEHCRTEYVEPAKIQAVKNQIAELEQHLAELKNRERLGLPL